MLHFKHKHFTFKDSLCFLNMPLTNFTKTFGLKELKKGWLPHKFSKLEHLEYEGQIPFLQFFEPAQMDKGKKEECATNLTCRTRDKRKDWNFQTETLEYCKSYVKLLKEVASNLQKLPNEM